MQEPTISLVEGCDFKEIAGIENNFHSGVIFELKEFLFFFDESSLYCFNVKKKKIVKYADQNCLNILHFTNQVNYAICSSDIPNEKGLTLYDLEDIVQNLK